MPPAARARPRAAYAVGVDLGGTWLRVLAEDGRGRRRAHRERAPGADALGGRLRALWRRWRIRPAEVLALAVAARGVWTPAERRATARRLGRLARRVRALPDVEAALRGALGDGPGVLLLAGTGSIALGRDSGGRLARAGGLGPLVGDEGSAFWIGREWLRRVAPDAARRLARRPDAVARIAALAPGVLRRARAAGPADRAGARRDARRVALEAQWHLAGLVVSAARACALGEPVAVSWAGGLLGDPAFRRGVWRAARSQGARVAPAAPRRAAVAAALALARQDAARAGALAAGAGRPAPRGPVRPAPRRGGDRGRRPRAR